VDKERTKDSRIGQNEMTRDEEKDERKETATSESGRERE